MLHSIVGSLSSGASVDVHEYPTEGLAHPVTVESVEHEVGRPVMTTVVDPPPDVQQKSVDVPSASATPELQVSVASLWSGVSLLAHLNPYESGVVQLPTVSSCAHVPAAKVWPMRQQ
jgi:hypothetical protein